MSPLSQRSTADSENADNDPEMGIDAYTVEHLDELISPVLDKVTLKAQK